MCSQTISKLFDSVLGGTNIMRYIANLNNRSSLSTMTITVVAPLARSSIALANNNQKVKVTQWGAPLSAAKHVVFYFGGLPASAEEPALHSAERDVYEERGIHLVCIDKPGMGGSTFQYNFSL